MTAPRRRWKAHSACGWDYASLGPQKVCLQRHNQIHLLLCLQTPQETLLGWEEKLTLPSNLPSHSLHPPAPPPPPAHHPGPISSFGRTVSLLHLCSFNSRGRNDEEEESPRWGEGPQVSSRQPDLECPEHVRALRPGPRPGHLCAQHVMQLEVQSLQLGWLAPNPRSMSRQISDFGEVVSSSMPQFSHL